MSRPAADPFLDAKVEYSRAITARLVDLHKAEWKKQNKKLVSAVLFGPLASGEYDEEIALLEVVKGYPYPGLSPEPAAIRFPSTRQFPMFGHLRLWVMSPEELKEAAQAGHGFVETLMAEPKVYLYDDHRFAERLLG